MYDTMEQHLAIVSMSAKDRLLHLYRHAQERLDSFDQLAIRLLRMEQMVLATKKSAHGFDDALMLSAKVRDAFHAISWNIKHYPFVKPHDEQCLGFGTVLRDGQPFELSGSMGCPGDHCDLSEDEVRKLAEERLAAGLKFLSEQYDDRPTAVFAHALSSESDFFAISAHGGTNYTAAAALAALAARQDVGWSPRWNRYILTMGEGEDHGGITLLSDLYGVCDLRPQPLPDDEQK